MSPGEQCGHSTVLVVDDDPRNRHLLASLLSREGFDCLTASGGAEALEILSQQAVGVVLLDLMMPTVDGLAVLAAMTARGLLPAVPVVVVTASDDRQMRHRALRAGAIDFLSKPLDSLEVICKVRALTELRRLRAESVAQLEQAAAAEQLVRVERAVVGLPLVVFELEARPGQGLAGNWLIGDSQKLNGVTAEDFSKPNHWVPLVHPDDRDAVQAGITAMMSGEKPLSLARFRLLVRGEYCWRLSACSLDETTGRIHGVVISIDDQVALEEQLRQAHKVESIGRLAGGIAHDFNNLLSVILSYSAFARDALGRNSRPRSDILEVIKAAERGSALTRQLLSFSGLQPTAKEPLDLNQALANLHRLLSRTVGEHIEFSIVPSVLPAIVVMDPVQFDQVVLNLAINARDAMPQGGKLTVALQHKPAADADADRPGEVQLVVSDTGTGIEDGVRRQMFEPFFTTKGLERGTGLGLAICQDIVREVNGFITVESSVGVGSSITVHLPLTKQVAQRRPRPVQQKLARKATTVLVVEDEAALRRVSARVLEHAGFVVHVAANGPEAMIKLEELAGSLQVLVSDVVMPGCSGYEVAERAALTSPGVGVVLTSGYLDEATRGQKKERLPVLWKPVAPRDLVQAVTQAALDTEKRRALDRPASRQALVVEDDKAAAAAVQRILAGAGFVARCVGSAAAAISMLRDGMDPAIVVCDWALTDGPALPLLAWIRSERPGLCPRVLITTGGPGAADPAGVQEAALFRNLAKPLDPQEFLAAVAAMTEPAPADQPTNAAQPALATRASGAHPPEWRRDRILVIDDDTALAAATQRILAQEDLDVAVVGSLAEARTALETAVYDSLVVDLCLPDGNGLQLLQELRGNNSEVPVVVVTGVPSVESATLAIRSRIHEYLPKPFASAELVRVVKAAVESGRVARLRSKLLAARFGGDEFVRDLAATERLFERAIDKIHMVFQPIIRSADGSVYGYEALLRCREPELATPLRLLAAAEVLGRVHDVGRAVQRNVADAMLDTHSQLEAIFVNLHPTELQAELLAAVSNPLLPLARRVVLEVTERAALEPGGRLDEELAQIRNAGYRLAVDDLGEGYSGLSSLVHLRPDIAKIDMSLVRGIHLAPLKRDIVAALVDMAHRSAITVVAEGVETLQERDVLVELGCDLLQGYLFARPGPGFPIPRTSFDGALKLSGDATDAPS